jgi:hypothetical protein
MSMAARGGNICCCVDDEGKFALRKRKRLHISLKQSDCGVIGKVRTGVPEPCRFPREDGRPGVQRETVVRGQKTFEHPTPKEACASGNEELLVAEGMPMAFCRVTDHFQVALG